VWTTARDTRFDNFLDFSLAKVPKKVYFCSEKKMTDESSRTDNESGITNPKTQLRRIANPPQLENLKF